MLLDEADESDVEDGPDDQAAGQGANRNVAERLRSLMSYDMRQLQAALRSNQYCGSDDEEEDRLVGGKRKKLPTRGPLSEGNRPRSIWALRDIQEQQLELLGKAALNLFDDNGNVRLNPETRKPYKTLQNKFAEDARDLLERNLLSNHSRHVAVV
jgi:hypothetical protein